MRDWWKDLFRPIRVTDARFGRLRFLRDARFWEGQSALLLAVGGDVEVLICGIFGGRPPTDQQRSFFAEVERRLIPRYGLPSKHACLDEARTGAGGRLASCAAGVVDVPENPTF